MSKEWKKEYNKKYYQLNKEKAKEYKKKNKQQTKKHHLKTKYKLSLEQYNKMVEDQSNCCAICDEILIQPCVDHNHRTGAVRELLCNLCNRGFGFFKENPKILEKAANYARFHNGLADENTTK